MATNVGNLDIGLVVGFIGGIAAFFQGFRGYRVARLLQDTPSTPIRSIAMGFVRIHGKAKSDQLVTSPVTHTPCCYYIVQIAKWEEFRDSRAYSSDEERSPRGGWMPHGADADGGWFYLEDATGHVMVAPRGAKFELDMTGTREVGGVGDSSYAAGGVSERELLAYVARVGKTPLSMMPGVVPGLGPLKAQAQQMQTQMQQRLEAQGPQSDPRAEELRLTYIELTKLAPWDSKYGPMSIRVAKMQERNRKLGVVSTVAQPQPKPPSTDVAAPIASPPAANTPLAADPPFSSDHPISSGRYQLTEYCILPDHDYDISGTCTQNPAAKDLNDRNLIRKGKNEPIYFISSQGRERINTGMQRGSMIMIYGGAIVGVFCLGLLLLRFGLL
jgi:hypothetical protein